jgi:N-6 DNA methylase
MIQSNFKKYTLEADVDDYVKVVLSALGLKKGVDYNEKSAMSDYMKEALKGAAKTKSKKLFGIPDFHLESRKIPVVIENKLGISRNMLLQVMSRKISVLYQVLMLTCRGKLAIGFLINITLHPQRVSIC